MVLYRHPSRIRDLPFKRANGRTLALYTFDRFYPGHDTGICILLQGRRYIKTCIPDYSHNNFDLYPDIL